MDLSQRAKVLVNKPYIYFVNNNLTNKTQQMKKLNPITFYKRLAITSSLLCVVCISFIFISANKYPQEAGNLETVSITTANTYFKNYIRNAKKTNTILKGMVISAEQLSAITLLSTNNPALNSIRIYYAKDAAGSDASLIVGVDVAGNDLVNTIYCTKRFNTGLCPPVCDVISPIISER